MIETNQMRTRIQQLEAQAGDQSRVQRVAEVRGEPIQSGGRWGVQSGGTWGTRIQQLEAQAGDQSYSVEYRKWLRLGGTDTVWGLGIQSWGGLLYSS